MKLPVTLPSQDQLIKVGALLLCTLIFPFLYTNENLAQLRAAFPIIDLKPLANFGLLVFGGGAIYLHFRARYFESVLAFSLLMFSSFYVLFLHNEVGFDNDFNDNASLMTLVHKLHYFGFGTDLFSAKYHNSYPFVWYYFCLKLLNLSGAQPFVALKFSQNLACFLVPILTYLAWSKIWSRSYASVFAMMSLGYLDFFKVNAWLGLILFVPLLPYLYRILKSPSSYKWPVEDAFWVGTIMILQYYWILIGILLFPFLWILVRSLENRSILPLSKSLLMLFVLFTLGGILSLPYTGPYTLDLVSNASEALVNRCYYDPMSLWHYPMTNSGLIGFETLVGFVSMILLYSRIRLMRWIFLILMVSFGSFYLLSSSMLLRFPSNFTKIEYIHTYLLVLAFSVSVVLLVFRSRNLIYKYLVMGMGLIIVHTSFSYIEVDHAFRPPHDKIDDLRPLAGSVKEKATCLSSVGRPLLYLPLFSFIPFNMHWSNPCQLYTQRADFVRALTRCTSPFVVSYALQHNRFEAVDLLIFENQKLEIILQKDNFPEPMTQEVDTFKRELLTPPAFAVKSTQQFEVFLPNAIGDWQANISLPEKELFEKEKKMLSPWLKE